MSEVKSIGVAILAECITLISITLALISDPKCQDVISFEADSPLINTDILSHVPTVLGILP
jgi:hypothetical protein